MNLGGLGGLEIYKPSETTNLYLYGMIFFKICDGLISLSEPTSVVYKEVTFTFTPIPVYE